MRTASYLLLAAFFLGSIQCKSGDGDDKDKWGAPVGNCHRQCEVQDAVKGCEPIVDLANCKEMCDQLAGTTSKRCAEQFDAYYKCSADRGFVCMGELMVQEGGVCADKLKALNDCTGGGEECEGANEKGLCPSVTCPCPSGPTTVSGFDTQGGRCACYDEVTCIDFFCDKEASSGGSGGAGGSGGTGERPELTIDDVPEAWERPDDCGGIGELCWDCGDKSICQLMDQTCVPSRAADASGSGAVDEPTPWCMSSVCMTFEEASCFCTGPAGVDNAQCQSGPVAAAGLCVAEGKSCLQEPCCNDLICVTLDRDHATCYQGCQKADDCESGCCTDLNDTGSLVCAPSDACEDPCLTEGESCIESSQCCRGSCHQAPEIPAWDGCRSYCYQLSECESGCCVPFSDSDRGFCADADWCQCGVQDVECGVYQPPCCDGFTCTEGGSADAPSGCRQNCDTDDNCSSSCCAPLSGTGHGVCMDASWCP